MAALKPAAECSLPELNARGLHELDLAEGASGFPEACVMHTQLAQGYFQAVTAAIAMAMNVEWDNGPDAAGEEFSEDDAARHEHQSRHDPQARREAGCPWCASWRHPAEAPGG